nr:hypothetical protein [Flavobacterium sp. ASV13]
MGRGSYAIGKKGDMRHEYGTAFLQLLAIKKIIGMYAINFLYTVH